MTEALALRIEPLTEADLPRLEEFYASLSPETVRFYDPWGRDRLPVLAKHLAGAARAKHLSLALASASGTIEGHAFILDLASMWPVFGIGLRERIRGCHQGGQLMDEVLRRTDSLGLPLVTLTVCKTNTRARALYESRGFAATGECTFRAELDSLRMERRGIEEQPCTR